MSNAECYFQKVVLTKQFRINILTQSKRNKSTFKQLSLMAITLLILATITHLAHASCTYRDCQAVY